MHATGARHSLFALSGVLVLSLPVLMVGTTGAAPAPSVQRVRPTAGGAGAGDPYYPRYGNRGYSVRHYDLRVRYDPATDHLRGRARITARSAKALSSFNLDFVGMHVRSVAVQGRRARWTRPNGHELVVRPRRALPDGRVFAVRVRYGGVPQVFRTPGLGVSAFLATRDGGTAIGEPEVAANWFPVNDHPADKATFRITLTAPRRLQTVANGLPSARRVHGRWATTTWRVRDPMASYLAFMSVGRYRVDRRVTAGGLPVIDAVDSSIRGALRRRVDASLAREGEIVRVESGWFGPYPFETTGGVVDRLPALFALENQTRPIYVPAFWKDPTAPTLGDDVVVHELAHQWFGDSVAVHRWRNIWLNEGFATYAEWLWNSRERAFTARESFRHYYAMPRRDPFWNLRIADPGVKHLFDNQIYIRGAMTLQALRIRVGTADFFRILRQWAGRHHDGNGTTAQFVALSERVSGRRLDRLFHAWLFSPTKPQRAARRAAAVSVGAVSTGADAAVRRWEHGLRFRLDHGAR